VRAQSPASAPFALKSGDTVVFYGDSITDQRQYTVFTEAYAVTRFPNLDVKFVHSGWGGDRVTGGGGGPIDLRLERDVLAYKPTVVTVMLGMNDASYRAFDENIFQTYAKGYGHIVDVLKAKAPGVRLTLIQPSPFDDVTRAPTFDGGYNAVLMRYSAFVGSLAQQSGATVADLNTPVVAMLQKANAADPENAAKILPDRVHPAPAGHLIMAEGLLKAWNAPAVVSSVSLDAAAGAKVAEAQNATVAGLAKSADGGLTWTQTDGALPFPLDPKDALLALAVKSSDFVDALDRQTLRVGGLTPGARYALAIDGGEPVGTFTAEELSAGVNLATLNTPMFQQAMDVLARTRRRAEVHNLRWRSIQVPLADDKAAQPKAQDAIRALDALDEQLRREQREAAKPKPHRFALTPVR
jgi:lysophospholipase L1-like esterase